MNIKKLAVGADVGPLLVQLDENPQLWNQNTMRTGFYDSPHGAISDIWVRYNNPANLNPHNPAAFNEAHDAVFYPAWHALPAIQPLVLNTMHYVAGTRLGGILITRIPARGLVSPHIDSGWHASFYEKFAISLKANAKQAFCFNGEKLITAPGDLFTFDNSHEHWVTNESDEERITLIICIRRE